MRNFINEFLADFNRHPAVSRLDKLLGRQAARRHEWDPKDPRQLAVLVPLALVSLYLAWQVLSFAKTWAFPNAQGFKRGTKVEPIVYRHPAENLWSGKQPGDSGAPTFAEAAAAAAAAPVEGGRTDKDATTDELPAAHAGHDGAPSFADAVKATEGGGLKKRK